MIINSMVIARLIAARPVRKFVTSTKPRGSLVFTTAHHHWAYIPSKLNPEEYHLLGYDAV
jgi:hypothetical protein